MRALVLVVALGSLAGCLYPDKEYAYSCVGQPAPTTAPEFVHIRGVTADPELMMPIPGVTVTLQQNGQLLNSTTSDAMAGFSFMLYTGKQPVGGLDLYAKGPGLIDSHFIPPRPVSGDLDVSLGLLSTQEQMVLAGDSGVTFTPGMGSVLLNAQDCNGQGLPGATITPPAAGGTVVYFNGIIPSKTATQTDDGGVALVANLAPGTVTLTAQVDGKTLTSSPILVSPDAFSIVALRP